MTIWVLSNYSLILWCLFKRKAFDMAATVFNQAQLELLDMMQWVKSPEALAELKQVISDFFAKKGQEELDAMWERGEMTEEKLKSFETLHERTPYRGLRNL